MKVGYSRVCEWLVSGSEGLTVEGVFVVLWFFVSVCLYVWCIRWGESNAF